MAAQIALGSEAKQFGDQNAPHDGWIASSLTRLAVTASTVRLGRILLSPTIKHA
jgi:hypothetical protein